MPHEDIAASNEVPQKACSLTREGSTISLDDLRMAIESMQADAETARRAMVAALKKNRRMLACCSALLSQLKDISLQS